MEYSSRNNKLFLKGFSLLSNGFINQQINQWHFHGK